MKFLALKASAALLVLLSAALIAAAFAASGAPISRAQAAVTPTPRPPQKPTEPAD